MSFFFVRYFVVSRSYIILNFIIFSIQFQSFLCMRILVNTKKVENVFNFKRFLNSNKQFKMTLSFSGLRHFPTGLFKFEFKIQNVFVHSIPQTPLFLSSFEPENKWKQRSRRSSLNLIYIILFSSLLHFDLLVSFPTSAFSLCSSPPTFWFFLPTYLFLNSDPVFVDFFSLTEIYLYVG